MTVKSNMAGYLISFTLAIGMAAAPAAAERLIPKPPQSLFPAASQSGPKVEADAAMEHPFLSEFSGSLFPESSDAVEDTTRLKESAMSGMSASLTGKRRSLIEKSTAFSSNLLARLKSLFPKF